MLVIGFGYKAHSGKDTAVNAIIEAYPQLDIRRYAFGDALKEEVAGREFELCMKHGLKYEPDNKHRGLLQYYGTEVRRKQDPFYWVRKLDGKLKLDNPQIALIADLRFYNECAYIRQQGGFTVKIVRQGYVDLSLDTSHRSERELDEYDFDITITTEDGNVASLKQSSIAAFAFILEHVAMPSFEDV